MLSEGEGAGGVGTLLFGETRGIQALGVEVSGLQALGLLASCLTAFLGGKSNDASDEGEARCLGGINHGVIASHGEGEEKLSAAAAQLESSGSRNVTL